MIKQWRFLLPGDDESTAVIVDETSVMVEIESVSKIRQSKYLKVGSYLDSLMQYFNSKFASFIIYSIFKDYPSLLNHRKPPLCRRLTTWDLRKFSNQTKIKQEF